MNVQAYYLDLTVDYRTLAFRGHLRIEGAPDGGELYLNSVGLEISGARAGETVLAVRPDPDHQEVVLSGLPPGASNVELDYQGTILADKLVGFYRSHFGDDYLLTTQFAPSEARRMLPCIDRPDRKAVFHVSVTVPTDLEVVFNTPVESTTTADGTRRSRFAPTPRMSTYLLYLGIGRFDVVRSQVGSIGLAAYAPPGRAEAGRYALGVAAKVLPEYERYYGIPYPLPKLDLVAVPEFWAGAMENWGAIAFSEMALLVDANTSKLRRRAVAETTAHEIAHMWFGNLVTMNWWSDVWLSESFATFMSYRILDRAFPEFESWADFLPRFSAPAFRSDSLLSTHPIYRSVESSDEVNQIFDDISYGKGASVLRMIEGYLGEETFRKGINAYLERYKYANASHDDLWSSLEEVSQDPVRRIMNEWISRPGLPMLVARVLGRTLTIDQYRFVFSGRHAQESWPVPVVARIDGQERRLLLDGPHTEIALTTDEPPLLNVGASGFYRVLYDLHTLERLRERFPSLSGFDQWSLVHDLGPLLVAGDLDLAQLLDFYRLGESATHFAVVSQYVRTGAALNMHLFDHPGFLEGYRNFLRRQTDRLGLDPQPGEPETNGALRESLLDQRVWIDLDFARQLAPRYAEYDRMNPEARDAVATAFVRTGGGAEFELVLRRFRSASSEAEMFRLVRALTAAPDPRSVERILSMAEHHELLLSLVPTVIIGASRNLAARELTWSWLQRNLDSVAESFRGTGRTSHLLDVVIPLLGTGREAEVRQFFRDRVVLESSQGIATGLELLDAGEAFRRRVGL